MNKKFSFTNLLMRKISKRENNKEKRSFIQKVIGVVAILVFALATKESLEFHQVNSIKVANCKSWGLGFHDDGTAPTANETKEELLKYDCYYLGDVEEKKIALSFDAGYDNGYTSKILDTLKEKEVNATFFVVGTFIDSNPKLIKRMKEEGHIIGNHTDHHKDMSNLSEEEFIKEIEAVETKLKTVIGTESDLFYRPPQGKYSIKNLEDAKKMGYKTCFWSLAYVDWYEDQQPTKKEAFDKLLGRIHNGAIVLLHSTSKTNCEILAELIDQYREMGYEIVSLKEIVEK